MPFDQAAIARAVTDTLATAKAIPPDHRGALLLVASQDGVKAVIAHRLSDDPNGWLISGYIEHPFSGGLNEGVQLQKTW